MPYIEKTRRERLDPLIAALTKVGMSSPFAFMILTAELASLQGFSGDVEAITAEIKCPGDLNYILARLFTLKIAEVGKSYHKLSEWRAPLEHAYLKRPNNSVYWDAVKDCSLEIYRKVFVPYEDLVAKRNGDVFDEIL